MDAGPVVTRQSVQQDIGPTENGTASRFPVPPSQLPDQAIRAEIAELAYLLWEEQGYPTGSAERDWLEAERRIQESIKHRPMEI